MLKKYYIKYKMDKEEFDADFKSMKTLAKCLDTKSDNLTNIMFMSKKGYFKFLSPFC
jgi:hypothetical protein